MKIGHIYYSLNFGGIETLLVNTTSWQANHDYIVDLILFNKQCKSNLISSLNKKVNLIQINRDSNSKGFFEVIKLNFIF